MLTKSGKVRICVDIKKLNEDVRRETFILPKIDDVISKLTSETVFTSIDAASGFYQMQLHENSQEMTTFIIPFGRYCFRRLPFAITQALEIFMRKMCQLFERVEGVFSYTDDVLVFGKDQKEHNRRLETDPEKVAAILDMPAPTILLLLRQVIGIVHFLGSYLPDLHNVGRPLNDLLKDDTVWAWGHAQDEAFVEMKMLVASMRFWRTTTRQSQHV